MQIIHSHVFPLSLNSLPKPKGLEVVEDFAGIKVFGEQGDDSFFEDKPARQGTVEDWYNNDPRQFATFVNRSQVVETYPPQLSDQVKNLMVDLEYFDWLKPLGRRVIELVVRSSQRYFPGKTIGVYGELAQAHELLDTADGREQIRKRVDALGDFRKMVGAVVCSVYPRVPEPSDLKVVEERFKWNVYFAEQLAGGKPVWCCWMPREGGRVQMADRDILTAAARVVKDAGHTLLAYDWTQGWDSQARSLWTEALELLAAV